MRIIDFLSLSPDKAKEHLVYGTIDPSTGINFNIYINNQKTKIPVIADKQGYWYWDNKEGYTITNLTRMFYNTNLVSVGFGSDFMSIMPTSLEYMFDGCRYLKNIEGLKNLNTSLVTSMCGMFGACSSLISLLGIENFDTSSVTNMESMFSGCSYLSNISALSNWDVSNVTSMKGMFSGCASLSNTSPIENWDISSVTNISSMLNNSVLRSLNLSNWVTTQVTSYTTFVLNSNKLTIKYDSTKWNPSIKSSFPNVSWIDVKQ